MSLREVEPGAENHSGAAAALVAAGVAVLLERPEEALRRLFAAQDVARAAGVHRQTFYRHFPEIDDFVAAVATATMSPAQSTEAVEPFLKLLADQDLLGAQELVRAAATYDYKALLADQSMGPQLLLWGIGAAALRAQAGPEALGTRLAAPLAETYEALTSTFVPYYETIAAGWGRRFEASFSALDFAVTLTALVEGLVTRSLAQPGVVREQLYADVVVALIERFTVPIAASSTAPATDPAPRDRPTSPPRRDARHKRSERSREAIIEAAAFEFEMRGFEVTTIADIARAAGLTEPTVFRHFGSKNRIATHVFARHLPELEHQLAQDLAAGRPLGAIHRHLVRLSALVRANRGIAEGLLEALRAATVVGPPTDPDDPRLVAPVPQVLLPALVAAQQAGELRTDLALPEVAASVSNLTVLHGITRSALAAEEAADHLFALFFEGLAAR